MFCGNCGKQIAEGAKFCAGCGQPVTPAGPPACPGCGTVIAEGAAFCGNCGHDLRGSGMPSSAANPPVAPSQQFAPAAVAPQAGAAPAAAAGKRAGWLIPVGYVFALLGGLIGIVLGAYLWRSKEKLPSGEKPFRYEASARRHGLIMLILGVIMFAIFKNMK